MEGVCTRCGSEADVASRVAARIEGPVTAKRTDTIRGYGSKFSNSQQAQYSMTRGVENHREIMCPEGRVWKPRTVQRPTNAVPASSEL